MPYIYCSKCGHKKKINTIKYRFIGIVISAFGVFGWFSFLFAGSGHAFLIACAIFFFGIYVFYSAEDMAKNFSKDKQCPKCNNATFEDFNPSEKGKYIDIDTCVSLPVDAHKHEHLEVSKSLFSIQKNMEPRNEQTNSSIQEDECKDLSRCKIKNSTAEQISSSKALFHVGETILVHGNVSEVVHFNNRTLINLGRPYPSEEVGILIWNNNLPSFTQVFGDLSNFEGNQICCMGKIEIYREHLQMKINSPNMIKIIKKIDNFDDVQF